VRLLHWGTDAVHLTFALPDDAPVALIAIQPGAVPTGEAAPAPGEAPDQGAGPDAAAPALWSGDDGDVPDRLLQALVEVSAFGHGRFPGSFRHVDTVLGAALRHVSHEADVDDDGTARLRIEQRDDASGLVVASVFEAQEAVAAFRTHTEVGLVPGAAPLTLDAVSTIATGAFLGRDDDVDAFALATAANDWVAESRWSTTPLRDAGLARIDRDVQHQPPRTRLVVGDRGSWSSGEAVPTAALLARDGSAALAWQVEHAGPWLFELGETRHGAYLLLSGPTDPENHWSLVLRPGEVFTSAPASVAVAAGGVDEVLAAMTAQRRATRLVREVDHDLPVVFNDYMNTLMGDPTTEKLLPLIDAAAEVGADYFCIDAGWYAEGHWWDTVGEWQPAASRFPGGIDEVLDRIRERGMVPGLWLEPEVIGVRSPLAASLPDDAFFSRGGVRVADHGRHLLDLRSPAARAHLDGVVDRLVGDHGVGFFKMDYNTMTGPGTDAGGLAPGAGLLEHSRALLAWLDAVQERHPRLLIENCASGAMRMDWAMMSRLHVQSTSDQQDPVMYATIAAAAPAALLPEQAGHWAYPHAGMEPELFTFSLVNAVLGRMYLSGHLNRMDSAQRDVVRAAVAAHRDVLGSIERAVPSWPLGLPAWEDAWTALALTADAGAGAGAVTHLSVWRCSGDDDRVVLPLPGLRGQEVRARPFFPADPAGWSWSWDPQEAELTVTVDVTGPTARVIEIRATGHDAGEGEAVA
jgi:alpha-galactosidase